MAVCNIIYNEGMPETYEGVEIYYYDKNKRDIFASGNFMKDWYKAIKSFIYSNSGEPLVHSSSVDHFITDGAPYDSAYLITNDKKSYLSYEYKEDAIELFIPEGLKLTWEEYKKMCETN